VRELMSSLTYLETCVGCSTESDVHTSGAASCASCTEHGADGEHVPSLIDQTRKTAAGYPDSNAPQHAKERP
jgi:hypothetical protein